MIPVIINNFNRLSTTKTLCTQLIQLGYTDIRILDQGSDYEPLMRWYTAVEGSSEIKVIYQPNYGPQALYAGYMEEVKQHPWIAYTDSDIELNPKTPSSFIPMMIQMAEHYKYHKVGLALKIDDLPDNEYAQYYKRWEEQFWKKELANTGIYVADVDTTFCVLKTDRPFGYQALRIGGSFTARHIPWYTDFDNLSEEEKQYLDKASDASTYKRYYRDHLRK